MHPNTFPTENLRVVVLSESTASGWPVCAYLRWALPVALDPVLAVMDAVSHSMLPRALLEAAKRALCLALDVGAVQPNRRINVVVVGTGMGGVASMKLHLLDQFRVFDAITLGAPLRPWSAYYSVLPSSGPFAVCGTTKHAECQHAPQEGQEHFCTRENGFADTPHRFCNVTFGVFGSCRAPTPEEDTPRAVASAAVTSAMAATPAEMCTALAAATVPVVTTVPTTFVTGAASFVSAAARRMWRSEHCVDEAHAVHVCTPDHSLSCWNPVVLGIVLERIKDTHDRWLAEERT